MNEIKITVAAPELVAALNELTEALKCAGCHSITQTTDVEVAAMQAVASAPYIAPTPAPASDPTPVANIAPLPATPAAPAPAVTAPAIPTAPAVPVMPTPTPTPAVPVAAPTYTMDALAKAGTALLDSGRGVDLVALLRRYGLTALTELPKEQYGAFATELRAMGAPI